MFFEKGILNGPTNGYYESRKCGYSGYYKNDEFDGLWEFYDEKTNEKFHAEFKDGYLIIDLDSITMKESNTLIKRIEEIY